MATADGLISGERLLQAHMHEEGGAIAELSVCYAELQITLKMEGGSKSFIDYEAVG